MPTWRCLSAMARTTPFRMGGLSLTHSADEFLAGTEEIVITPQSDPPLRSGTYFVSVGVFATGVEVNCTLTAEVELDGEAPPPMPGGRPLTPGQPVSFRRGPVDTPTLFRGDFSFRLEVPDNAVRVTFTLESDVDVSLACPLWRGQRLSGSGGLSLNYSSRNLTGNEEIVITPQSDPPLRAGTYFVSVASLCSTGVIANCTLTAEVELDEEDQTPISGGPLTPGQPADFRLGPVDSPTLFTVEISRSGWRVLRTPPA